jgi:hypothetical protein
MASLQPLRWLEASHIRLEARHISNSLSDCYVQLIAKKK